MSVATLTVSDRDGRSTSGPGAAFAAESLRDLLKQAGDGADAGVAACECAACGHGFSSLFEGDGPALIDCPLCAESLVLVRFNGAPQTMRYRTWLKAAASGPAASAAMAVHAPEPLSLADAGEVQAPRRRSWLPWFLGICAVFSTAGLAFTSWLKNRPTQAEPRPRPTSSARPAAKPVPVAPASPFLPAAPTAKLALQQEAKAVLDRFLAGPVSVRTALALPGKVGGFADGPVTVTRLLHLDTVTDTRKTIPLSSFRVFTPECPHGALVHVWHTIDDGPRVDGQLFAEQQTHQLRDFLARKSGNEITVHARLVLVHSFDREAPDQATFLCVKVLDPADDSITARAYADLLLKEAPQLAANLSWSEPRLVQLKLVWAPARPERGAPGPFLSVHSLVNPAWTAAP